MVFKKPLQDQNTRETYFKQRQELRKAKELGYIDVEAYEEAKKGLLPHSNQPASTTGSMFDFNSNANSKTAHSITANQRSRMSGSTSSSSGSTMGSVHYPTEAFLPNPERKKASTSILQRSNVAVSLFNPNAQSEEDREILRLRRKAQKALAEAERFERLKNYQYQLSEEDQDGTLDPSRFDHLTLSPELLTVPTNDSTITNSTSSVSGRSMKSQRMNFNIFRKRSASISRGSPPPLPPPNAPPIPLLQRTGTASSSISSSSSSLTRRHTDARNGGREAILEAMPMNFADIFLMGPSPTSQTRPPSRRHSFSSQHSRPSVAISRRSTEAPPDLVIRRVREEFVLESRPVSPIPLNFRPNTPPEEKRPPMSTVLRDMFLSLLQDFEDTSILFSYPKYGKIKRVSYTSSLRSVVRSVKEDEEWNVDGGEGSFFLDESAGILRAVLEKQVWFLMAMKWLSFGRVLFSPGHHLIELSGDVGIAMGVSESSILDLDGVVSADYSWHLAEEYPFTTIYNVLLPHSPRPQRNSTSPPNVHHITAPTLSNLSALPSNSIDVIVSHNLPLFLLQHKHKTTEELIQLTVGVFRECARVLKPHGYFEITIVDPVMNNMGPRTRTWIAKNIPLAGGMKPSKIILTALERLGSTSSGVNFLFDEVKECWVWMPTTSIGDELSTVTSMVGRHLYDHLYTPAEDDDSVVDVVYGMKVRRECMIWKDDKIVEECQKENTAFKWLKCYARKI